MKAVVNDVKHKLSALRQVVDALVDAAVNAGLGLAPDPDQIQLLAPFQLTINDLLSWLRGHLPQVEYRYHTPSVPLKTADARAPAFSIVLIFAAHQPTNGVRPGCCKITQGS